MVNIRMTINKFIETILNFFFSVRFTLLFHRVEANGNSD